MSVKIENLLLFIKFFSILVEITNTLILTLLLNEIQLDLSDEFFEYFVNLVEVLIVLRHSFTHNFNYNLAHLAINNQVILISLVLFILLLFDLFYDSKNTY